MSAARSSIYNGDVVHKRFSRVSHGLRYRVFSLLLDCARLDDLGRELKLFSYNRLNLFSIFDKDYGDGTPLNDYLLGVAKSAGRKDVERFYMLAYPRVFGIVFNPLTVYYGLDQLGQTRLIIYEVRNTFGEKNTYVLPAQPDENGHVWQQCPKQFFVSPFNKVSGTYSFHASPIGDDLTLGVVLRDEGQPVLRAHFRGVGEGISDRGLMRALNRTGFLTVKVLLAIHYQAAKLWVKGLRAQKKPPAPSSPITFFKDPLSGIECAPLVENGN